MMTSRRTVLIVVAALALGTLGALVAGVGRDPAATGLGTYGGSGVQADGVLAEDETTTEDGAAEEAALADPAKQQPTLDKFVVKDPFIPLSQPNTGANGTGTNGPPSADDDGDADTGGHTISVVSISVQNGVAMATLEVDGKTYADKKVGDVFSTGWGEIKIVSIDAAGKTVTIQHGDQTLTLRVGQVVVK